MIVKPAVSEWQLGGAAASFSRFSPSAALLRLVLSHLSPSGSGGCSDGAGLTGRRQLESHTGSERKLNLVRGRVHVSRTDSPMMRRSVGPSDADSAGVEPPLRRKFVLFFSLCECLDKQSSPSSLSSSLCFGQV